MMSTTTHGNASAFESPHMMIANGGATLTVEQEFLRTRRVVAAVKRLQNEARVKPQVGRYFPFLDQDAATLNRHRNQVLPLPVHHRTLPLLLCLTIVCKSLASPCRNRSCAFVHARGMHPTMAIPCTCCEHLSCISFFLCREDFEVLYRGQKLQQVASAVAKAKYRIASMGKEDVDLKYFGTGFIATIRRWRYNRRQKKPRGISDKVIFSSCSSKDLCNLVLQRCFHQASVLQPGCSSSSL